MMEDILDRLCRTCHCTPDELRSRNKQSNIADARRMFCYILNKDGMHPAAIGSLILRDRTTVIYLIKKTAALLEVRDKETIKVLDKLAINV